MEILNKDLKRRIIEISYKHKLSHLGSCLTAVDIIDYIFSKSDAHRDRFILSSGHAGLALYVVLEKYFSKDAEKIFNHHGVHPDRCFDCGIYCSSGSLGHGIGIAVGSVLGNPLRNVYCLISDGESAEGSVTEALRIAEQYKVTNLETHINVNGWAAYQRTDDYWFPFKNPEKNNNYQIWQTNVDYLPFLVGQDAHYHTMTEAEYKQALEILK